MYTQKEIYDKLEAIQKCICELILNGFNIGYEDLSEPLTISDSEVKKMQTVGDLVDYIWNKKRRGK